MKVEKTQEPEIVNLPRNSLDVYRNFFLHHLYAKPTEDSIEIYDKYNSVIVIYKFI